MTSNELRNKFLEFFKKRGHVIVPSSSLLPTDPSVLFTTAGMQQFSLYLSGKKDVLADFNNCHLASSQKCFRTGDIEEIGDDTHHTFFEMLEIGLLVKMKMVISKKEQLNMLWIF
jgi:alanyl-tRNA synthetase